MSSTPARRARQAAKKQAQAGAKHLSQLDATGKARAQQTIQDCLLAIVASQKAPLKIAMEELEAYSTSRLKIEIEDGYVILTAEKAQIVKAVAPPKLEA